MKLTILIPIDCEVKISFGAYFGESFVAIHAKRIRKNGCPFSVIPTNDASPSLYAKVVAQKLTMLNKTQIRIIPIKMGCIDERNGLMRFLLDGISSG
jgi:hypothetical protein